MSDLRSRAADLLAALRVYPKDGRLVLDAMEALDVALRSTDVDDLRSALADWAACQAEPRGSDGCSDALLAALRATDVPSLDWPTLANIIREVDGNHDLGAGELAERILAHPRFRATDVPSDRLREAALIALSWRDMHTHSMPPDMFAAFEPLRHAVREYDRAATPTPARDE